MLTTTLLSYVKGCRKPLKRLNCSPHYRQRDRSGTTIGKLMPFHWKQVIWSWLKLTPTGGGGKWRTGGRRNHRKWRAGLLRASLPTSWGTSGLDAHESYTETDFSSSFLQRGLLSVQLCKLSGQKNLLYKLTWNLSENLWEGDGFSCPPQCESVKLFPPPSMSNVWHKGQNSV